MMPQTVLITGSAGLIGSEAALFFDRLGYTVHGLDNNARKDFFGPDGDTSWNLLRVQKEAKNLIHHYVDIRDRATVEKLVGAVKPDCVLHCAAQPAHEYARTHPVTDFEVNVTGTVNLLDACHQYCPDAPFLYCSSSKVYGRINEIPYVELLTRYEAVPDSGLKGVSIDGITEEFPLDGGDGRGIYGTGKAASDLLVQEYGRTYGMPTVCLRGNCMTGSGHSPAELHGFLAYLARCVMEGRTYNILGFKGKQVRDVIHSFDFVSAMHLICLSPPEPGTVYNLGGGLASSLSIIEAIDMLEEIGGRRLSRQYADAPRVGDHRIYISDTSRFRSHYPAWQLRWNLEDICRDLVKRFDASRVPE